jgi:hypothetical protein
VMGDRFWYGLSIIASFTALAFAIVWIGGH